MLITLDKLISNNSILRSKYFSHSKHYAFLFAIIRSLIFMMTVWQKECINQLVLSLYLSISRSLEWRIKNKNYREHQWMFAISYSFVVRNKKWNPGIKRHIISFLTHTGHTTYYPMQFLRILIAVWNSINVWLRTWMIYMHWNTRSVL